MSACMIPTSSIQRPTSNLSGKQSSQKSILLEKPSENQHKKRLLQPSKPIESSIHILKNDFSTLGEDSVNIKTVAPFPYSTSSATVSGSVLFEEGGEIRNEPWNSEGGTLVLKGFSITPDAGGSKISATVSTAVGPSSYFITAMAPASAPAPGATEYSMSAALDPTTSAYVLSHDPTGTTRRYKFTQGNISVNVSNGQAEVKITGLSSPQLTRRECFVIGTRIECADIPEGNNKILSGNITLSSSFNQNEYTLRIESDHDIIGEGQDSQEANISLQTFGTEKDWTVKIDDGEEIRILRGTGDLPLLTTLKAEDLEEGAYEISANYDEFPDEVASIEVQIVDEPECGDGPPLLPEDLGGVIEGLNGVNLSGEGFRTQSITSDNIKQFFVSKNKMSTKILSLSDMNYPVGEIKSGSTFETVPSPENFEKPNKIKKLLESYFEARTSKQIAKQAENERLNRINQQIIDLKSYSQDFFSISFEPYTLIDNNNDFEKRKGYLDHSIEDFNFYSYAKNTPYLLISSQIYTNILGLYYQTAKEYILEEKPANNEDLSDYTYENMKVSELKNPYHFLKFLDRKIPRLNQKLNTKLSDINSSLEANLAEAEEISTSLDSLEQDIQELENEGIVLEQEISEIFGENIVTEDATFSIQSQIPDAGPLSWFWSRGRGPRGRTTNWARSYYSKTGKVTPKRVTTPKTNYYRALGQKGSTLKQVARNNSSLRSIDSRINANKVKIKDAKAQGNSTRAKALKDENSRLYDIRKRIKKRGKALKNKLKAIDRQLEKSRNNTNNTNQNTLECHNPNLRQLGNDEVAAISKKYGQDLHRKGGKPHSKFDYFVDPKSGNVFFVKKGNPKGAIPTPTEFQWP